MFAQSKCSVVFVQIGQQRNAASSFDRLCCCDDCVAYVALRTQALGRPSWPAYLGNFFEPSRSSVRRIGIEHLGKRVGAQMLENDGECVWCQGVAGPQENNNRLWIKIDRTTCNVHAAGAHRAHSRNAFVLERGLSNDPMQRPNGRLNQAKGCSFQFFVRAPCSTCYDDDR